MPSGRLQTEVGTQAQRAKRLLTDRGMVRLRDFIAAGIAEETLARLVRQGEVVRAARGLYQHADLEPDVAHTMAEAAKIVPNGVVCLVSALQFHGLTVQTPSRVWIAIRRSSWTSTATWPPMRFVYFGESAFGTAIETHKVKRVPVRVYGVAKTVVDCFRYRNKIGIDIALEALREALGKRCCSPSDISKMAQKLRIQSVIRPYLEAATDNGT